MNLFLNDDLRSLQRQKVHVFSYCGLWDSPSKSELKDRYTTLCLKNVTT